MFLIDAFILLLLHLLTPAKQKKTPKIDPYNTGAMAFFVGTEHERNISNQIPIESEEMEGFPTNGYDY